MTDVLIVSYQAKFNFSVNFLSNLDKFIILIILHPVLIFENYVTIYIALSIISDKSKKMWEIDWFN